MKIPSTEVLFTGNAGQVKMNKYGEYQLDSTYIKTDTNQAYHNKLYDGSLLIAEINYDGKKILDIKIGTNKKINIVADIQLDHCSITSAGSVHIDGELTVKSNLIVQAEAAHFAKEIKAEGDLEFDLKNNLVFAKPVTSRSIKVNAAHYIQENNLDVEDRYDVTVDVFQQHALAKTNINGMMCLISKKCEIAGDFSANNDCFLATQLLVLGSDRDQHNISFKGNNYLHAVNCNVKGDTQLVVDKKTTMQTSRFIVDSVIDIDKKAAVDIENTRVAADTVYNLGEFTTDNCVLVANTVQQQGLFYADESDLTICKKFSEEGKSTSKIKKSKFISKETLLHKGKLHLEHSEYIGENCHIIAGSFVASEHCELNINDSISIFETARCNINKAKIFTKELSLNGLSSIKNSYVDSKSLTAYKNKITIEDSEITTEDTLALAKDVSLKNARLNSADIRLAGELDIHDAKIRAKAIRIDSKKANIAKCFTESKYLTLQGSENKGDVIISESELVADFISQREKVKLEKSFLIGMGGEKSSNDIRGQLELSRSSFITRGQVFSYPNSEVGIVDHGCVQAMCVANNAKIAANNSSIYTDRLVQTNAEIATDRARIKIKQASYSKQSKIDLTQYSILTADHIYHDGQLQLSEKSAIEIKNNLISGKDSKINSDDAYLKAKKIITLGPADLRKSILSADELVIYEKFKAKDDSNVRATDNIAITKNAKASLYDSTLQSKKISNAGNLHADTSKIIAQNEIKASHGSKTTLVGNTAAVANNIFLYGEVNVATKKIVPPDTDDQEETEKNKLIPQLQATNLLETSREAKIKGDDLIANAEHITHLGSIDLKGAFQAIGTELDNYGNLKAEQNISLGFDDVVINAGLMSSNNITINSNFVNALGMVSARDNYNNSGFYSLNFGVIAASNNTTNSLFSLNAGLMLPNIPSSPRFWLSEANLRATAKTVLTTAASTYSNVINLAFMVPGLINTSASLYGTYQKYGWGKIKSMRRHEVMPLVCQLKSAAVFGYNAYNTSKDAYTESENFRADATKLYDVAKDKNNYTYDNFNDITSKINWSDIGKRTLSVVGGNYIDESILHVNTGASLAHNTMKSSFFHNNYGLEASLQSHSINTRYLNNSGISTGGESSYTANTVYNSGELTGRNRFTLKAEEMLNRETGRVNGNKVKVELNKLEQAGDVHLSNGLVDLKQFTDTISATTKLDTIQANGDTFDLLGRLAAKGVTFNYKNSFTTHDSSIMQTDNVSIKTKAFTYGGKGGYENVLSVEAETVKTLKGSEIQGQKATEDELYQTIEKTSTPENASTNQLQENVTDKNETENANTDKESSSEEKIFKPKNMLKISADVVSLGGKQRGGDYTNIEGLREQALENVDNESATQPTSTKCKEFTVEESADIDISQGSIKAEKGNIDSVANLTKFNLEIDVTEISTSGNLGLNQSYLTGQQLISDGYLLGDQAKVNVDTIKLNSTATEVLKNSTVISVSLTDDSQMQYQGQNFITATEYKHGGHINKLSQPEGSEQKNLFYLKSNTANLHGTADIDSGYFDIAHFADGTQFVAGQGKYRKYNFSDSLNYITEDKFHLHQEIARNADVAVQASDILLSSNYAKKNDLSLIATKGNVIILGTVNADNIYAKAAHDIYTNNTVQADQLINFDADGTYYNLGGTLNGDVVNVKAATIKNITAGSELAKGKFPYVIGGAGVINGRSKTFLEATVGNIENHGGVIRANDYTQLIAKGDVINLCNVSSYRTKYDVRKEFDPGLIAGGNGSTTEGMGLYVQAGGRVYSDASDFISNGNNYIEGMKGVEFQVRHHTYIAKEKHKKKALGFGEKHTIKTQTDIKGSVVHSANGRNIIRSSEGEVVSVATQFSSPGGTDVYAKKDVKLYSLKTKDKKYKFESSWWGLSERTRKEVYRKSTPTLFIDNGLTRVHSAEGDVDARGAYFVGDGDIYIKAKNRIKFGCDILDHEIKEKSQSLSLGIPGMGAWGAFSNSGNLWNAATAEDATLAKIDRLSHSSNMAEFIANSSNLGINLFNTTNSIMRGIAGDTLSSELMSRYGLGGADGFAPAISVGFNKSNSTTRYQTQGMGGVNRGGNAIYEAGEGIDLENGVRVHVKGNKEINTPEILAHAAALKSSYGYRSRGVKVGVTPAGQVTDVGVSYSHNQSQVVNHVNAELSADGNMKLHNNGAAINLVELDGANIKANTLAADINKLSIIDKHDTCKTKSEFVNFNSSGQISASKAKGSERVTNNHSGLDIQSGINTDGHVVTVRETYMEGGAITTAGENNFQTDKLIAVTLEDKRSYKEQGFSGNVNDINRLFGQQPTNSTGENAIATATITFSQQDYKAKQKPVVFGDQGTHLNVKEIIGEVHTTSRDGKEVIKDKSLHLAVDAPITNREHIAQAVANIAAGTKKIADTFMHQEEIVPKIFMPEMPTGISQQDELNDKLLTEAVDETFISDAENIADITEQTNDSEMIREIVDNALENLQFESPQAQHEYNELLSLAANEFEANGSISKNTEQLLSDKMSDALISTIKTGTEFGMETLNDCLSKESIIKLLSDKKTSGDGYVKIGIGAKGLVITYLFNAGLSRNAGGTAEILTDAADKTLGDVTFSLLLTRCTGAAAAGPIGWTYTVLGVFDTLFYDQAVVDKIFVQGIEGMAAARDVIKNGGSYWEFENRRQLGADALETARQVQAQHTILQAQEAISDGFKWLRLNMFGSNQQVQDASDTSSNAAAMDNHGLFRAVPRTHEEIVNENTSTASANTSSNTLKQ